MYAMGCAAPFRERSGVRRMPLLSSFRSNVVIGCKYSPLTILLDREYAYRLTGGVAFSMQHPRGEIW